MDSDGVWPAVVMLVSPDNSDWREMQGILGRGDWLLRRARGCTEALNLVRERETAVVLCCSLLPDGTWRDLLARLRELDHPPNLMVLSEAADDFLWADVLDEGGYDLLSLPLNPGEALQAVRFANAAWHLNLHAGRVAGTA